MPRIHLDLRARYSKYKTRNGKTWEFGSTRPFDSNFLEFSFSHDQTDLGSSVFNGGLPSDMGGGDDPPTKPQRGNGGSDVPYVLNKSPEQWMKERGIPQSGRIDQDYTFEKIFIPFSILKSLIFNSNNKINPSPKLVDNAAKQLRQWLGKDYKVVTNKAGDKIFMSKDGLRKIRFDIKNSHGDAPHLHLEIFKNGKRHDAIQGTHRIYPNP